MVQSQETHRPPLRSVLDDCGIVKGLDDLTVIRVADDVPDEEITTVMQAHDQTKTQPDPRADRLARIAARDSIPRAQRTSVEKREPVGLIAQELTV